MLLFEPVFLHLFGTTPGKWLLGLRVVTRDGKRMSYYDALCRTMTVLAAGYGLFIPFFSLWRLWRSFKSARAGEVLSWDEYGETKYYKEDPLRTVAYVGAWGLCLFLVAWVMLDARLPQNRGELTPEAFAQNYNDLMKYYYNGRSTPMRPDGSWGDQTPVPGSVVVEIGESDVREPLRFEVRNGFLIGLRYGESGSESFINLGNFQRRAGIMAGAFIGADDEVRLFSRDISDIITSTDIHPFRDITYTFGEYTLSIRLSFEGYELTGTWLIAREGTGNPWYTVELTIEKAE